MSQQFMEKNFPLAARSDAAEIRRVVDESLYSENVESTVADDSPSAVSYLRADHEGVMRTLEDRGIKLADGEEAQLIDFASEYASLVDQENDTEELQAAREREAQNAQFVEEKTYILENWREKDGSRLPVEVAEAAARTLLRLRERLAKEAMK